MSNAAAVKTVFLITVNLLYLCRYHSPNVHGLAGTDRTGHIWGDLVTYGFADPGFGPSHAAPWRVGANETTTIKFSNDVTVEGNNLKAGMYGLFLDVEEKGPWN
jgi:Protein of unknown function (DUF2911)